MSGGVALPAPHWRILPGVVAERAVVGGVVETLAWLERCRDEAQAQADRYEVDGKPGLADIYRGLAAGFARDACYFAASHADSLS